MKMANNTADAIVTVVLPTRLEVHLLDVTEHTSNGKNPDWSKVSLEGKEQELFGDDSHILIEKHCYMLWMELYDKDGHLLTLTENVRFMDEYAKNYKDHIVHLWRD